MNESFPKPQIYSRARAKLRIYASQAGMVLDAIETLRAIESAYLQLYASNIYLGNVLADTDVEKLGKTHMSWSTDIERFTSSEKIRRHLMIADDQLVLSAAQFGSAGFWEVLGTLNPLEQLRTYINERHERKKDNDYRNEADRTRRELENELLAVKVFSSEVEALRQLKYREEEIRRMILPAARWLKPVGAVQDEGLIETAEIEPLERQRIL